MASINGNEVEMSAIDKARKQCQRIKLNIAKYQSYQRGCFHGEGEAILGIRCFDETVTRLSSRTQSK
jgi:hypothetical protein